jgi:hypothetical protein
MVFLPPERDVGGIEYEIPEENCWKTDVETTNSVRFIEETNTVSS